MTIIQVVSSLLVLASFVHPSVLSASAFISPPGLRSCAYHVCKQKQAAEGSGGSNPIRAEAERDVTDKPSWAGGGLASDIVSSLISIKPLYEVLKFGARQMMINTAESKGVMWRADAKDLLANQDRLEEIYKTLVNTDIENGGYPEYYLLPFHAYPDGNLNWLAAAECNSATYSMSNRIWPKEDLQAEEAQVRLRKSYMDFIDRYSSKQGARAANDILELGCSVGTSTRYLARHYPSAAITGIDLSPYFLSVAKYMQEEGWEKGSPEERIRWLHSNAECTGLGNESFDLVTIPFVVHELPCAATSNVLVEAHRVLRPGGVISVTEIDPTSPVIQGLPAPIFTMMKSTEPHSDSYYIFNLEERLRSAGFSRVLKEFTDPRHSTWMAIK